MTEEKKTTLEQGSAGAILSFR